MENKDQNTFGIKTKIQDQFKLLYEMATSLKDKLGDSLKTAFGLLLIENNKFKKQLTDIFNIYKDLGEDQTLDQSQVTSPTQTMERLNTFDEVMVFLDALRTHIIERIDARIRQNKETHSFEENKKTAYVKHASKIKSAAEQGSNTPKTGFTKNL